MDVGLPEDLPLLQSYNKQQQLQEQAGSARTAFSLFQIHFRRDASRITAVAMDSQAHRVFLGLSSGCVCN